MMRKTKNLENHKKKKKNGENDQKKLQMEKSMRKSK